MVKAIPAFIGIELHRSAGRNRRPYVYVSLDSDLTLIAIGHGDRNETLAYIGGQQSAYVAINAPRKPNNGAVNLKAAYQITLAKSHQKLNCRLAEYLLRAEGLSIAYTAAKPRSCPRWVQHSFTLFKCLDNFGYQPYPSDEVQHQSLEVCTADIFLWLLGCNPLPEHSLEGRIQRQLILYEKGLQIADAMDYFLEITRFKLLKGDLPIQNIHNFEELNALAAAYLAWSAYNNPSSVRLLGDFAEGQIVSPCPTE